MYTNKNFINTTLSNNDGKEFSDDFYWISLQDEVVSQAWRLNLDSGVSSGYNKTTLCKVRPIRSF